MSELLTMREAAAYLGWAEPNSPQRLLRTLQRLERSSGQRLLTRPTSARGSAALVTKGVLRRFLRRFRGTDDELFSAVAGLVTALRAELRELTERIDEHDSKIATLDVAVGRLRSDVRKAK